MIKNYIQLLGLPCAGKSTELNKRFPDVCHIIDKCCNHFKNLPYEFNVSEDMFTQYDFLYKNNDIFIISADELKKYLPGYTEEHPEIVHEKSVRIVQNIIYSLSISDKINIDTLILDGGGINNHYNTDIINILKLNNVEKIITLFFDTPIEVCIKRLENRSRKVPIEEIYKKNQKLISCMNKYIELSDEFIRIPYFTNKYIMLDMDGTIASYNKAKFDIHGNIDFVNSCIFKNSKPVKHVIDYIKNTCEQKNTYIITACPNSISWNEKNEWLNRYLPWIPTENRYWVGNKNYKHVFIEQLCLKNKWDPKDVTLIDDYHDTLSVASSIGINVIHPSNIEALWNNEVSVS